MKKYVINSICLIGLMLLKPSLGHAQQVLDSTNLYQVVVNDATEFIGNIISECDTSYQFRTGKYGQFTILKSDVKKLVKIDKANIVKGKLWMDNPQSSRYLFMPDGYGLKAGEGYYQNIWVLLNQVSVGVTDYFSVGFGMVPTFLFGTSSIPVWVVPKFSVPVVKDKFNLGIGAFAGTVIGSSNTGFGIVYGLGTFGDRNTNLSIGLGYGYAGGNFAKSPLISLAGMLRVSPRGYLITENYFIKAGNSETIGLISLGARSLLGKISLDYGLFIPVVPDLDRVVALPWLGISIPFGKKVSYKNSNNLQ